MSRRLEAIDAMIARGATDAFAYYARAMELRSLGRAEEALEAYGDVVARFPNYVPTYLMAGQLARTLGREDVARRYFERGLERAGVAGDEHAAAELRAALGAS